MGWNSSSDSDYSSSSKRKKKGSSRRRRSRSSSYERSRRKHGKSGRKNRRSRSRSYCSERSNSVSKRRRSRDRPRHHESKSRTRRSRDRSASPVRRKKHIDAVMGVGTGTLKDVMDILPGFSKMTPAEQSRIRIQRALDAAVETSKNDEGSDKTEDNTAAEEENSMKQQIERAIAIQAVGDDDDDEGDAGFLPSHFRSSTKGKKKIDKANEAAKKSYMERESTHEVAIFGHAGVLNLDQALKKKQEIDEDALYKAKRRIDYMQRDPRTLVADDLLVTPEEAAARWRSKLVSLHRRFAKDFETTA